MTISQDMVGENKGGVHVILITTARYDSLSTRYHCLSCHFHMNLIHPHLKQVELHLHVLCGEEIQIFIGQKKGEIQRECNFFTHYT